MPPFLVPRHVSAHRISAIALYRALLQQSRAVPLPAESKAELQNIVRNRCKQTIHLHSYQRLRLAFQAGYEAIEHLDASVAGDEKSTSYIAELIGKAPAKVKADPPRPVLAKGKRKTSKDESSKHVAAPPPFKPSTELLSRPHPLRQLSGKRHVPVLFTASKIPVLRIKKPQPPNLSGFIRHRIEQRQRRHDRRHWLEEQVEFAQYEDLWDEIVEEHIGVDAEVEAKRDMLMEPTWAEEFQIAKEEVEFKIKEELRKNAAMAVRMQEVVDRETELLEREKKARKEAKRLARAGKKGGVEEQVRVKEEGVIKGGGLVKEKGHVREEGQVKEEPEKENIFRVIKT
jgi:hypothetical protein